MLQKPPKLCPNRVHFFFASGKSSVRFFRIASQSLTYKTLDQPDNRHEGWLANIIGTEGFEVLCLLYSSTFSG